MSQFPKGTSKRRTGQVEGETKEQWMLMFKFLAGHVKKKETGVENSG